MSNKPDKKRLDVLLVERRLVDSRAKAQALILAGQVQVRQRVHSCFSVLNQNLIKPGTLIFENAEINVTALPKYVSRGGEKLEAALEYWKIDVRNKVCWDVGSSTGGFTDCLLQRGASKVYGVDVGTGQMHPKLRNDSRVELYEKTHVLKWVPPWIERPQTTPVFVTVDVSFISLKNVLKRIVELLVVCSEKSEGYLKKMDSSGMLGSERGYEILALIKPQFEVGVKGIRKGIVRDDGVRLEAIERVVRDAEGLGLEVVGHTPCSVAGAKGNREEFMYARCVT